MLHQISLNVAHHTTTLPSLHQLQPQISACRSVSVTYHPEPDSRFCAHAPSSLAAAGNGTSLPGFETCVPECQEAFVTYITYGDLNLCFAFEGSTKCNLFCRQIKPRHLLFLYFMRKKPHVPEYVLSCSTPHLWWHLLCSHYAGSSNTYFQQLRNDIDWEAEEVTRTPRHRTDI